MRLRAKLRAILSDSSEQSFTPPESIEWMPAGSHTVFATTPDGGGAEITTVATPETADALNSQLQVIIDSASRGECSRPFVDFNHAGADASAIPLRFFWDDGVRLALEWTAKGIDALRGRVYSYFSPEFLLGDDGTISLPPVGPIGGLVNTPAYQSIERIAAKMPGTPDNNKGQQMEELIKMLVADGMLPADTKMDCAAGDIVAAIKAKLSAAMTDVETAKTDGAAVAAKLANAETVLASFAKSDVDAAVADGRIDQAAKEHWLASYKSNPATARAMLGSVRQSAKIGHDPNNLPGPKGGSNPTGLDRVRAAFAKARGEN